MGFLLYGPHEFFFSGRLTTLASLVGLVGPGPVGCLALPCVEVASHCVVGLGHDAAGYSTLGGPGVSAGSLVGRVGVQETPGLVPAHWLVKPDPEASTRLLACRATSWGLAAGVPEVVSGC